MSKSKKSFENYEEEENEKVNELEKTDTICKVVIYSPEKKYAVISFEGVHLTIHDVEENPGEYLEVEYIGEIYTPEFDIHVKK